MPLLALLLVPTPAFPGQRLAAPPCGAAQGPAQGLGPGPATTIPAGPDPWNVTVNPVNGKVYVVNHGCSDVTVIDGATNATTTVGVGDTPQTSAVNTLTGKVYVANTATSDISVIDGATNSVLTTIDVGGNPYALAVDPGLNKVYVANAGDNTLSVIDGASDTVTGSPLAVGTTPVAVAVNPVTHKVYVLNLNSQNVTLIDGLSDSVLDTLALGAGARPLAVAVNPVTNKVYVASGGGGNPVSRLSVIDGATDAVSTSVDFAASSFALALAVNPVTNKVYVALRDLPAVAVVDGASGTLSSTIDTADAPEALVVNPTTNRVYVVHETAPSALTVIDGATDSVASDTQPVGDSARSLGVNPVTNRIYVASYGSDDVTVVDGATNDTATVDVEFQPRSVAVNPATDTIYVANEGADSVTVIDGATNATEPVATGDGPSSVAVNPVTNKVYVADWDDSSGNTVTVIDGATNATTTLSVGFSPYFAAVNPVTNRIYVGHAFGDDVVTVIDGATETSVTIPGIEVPESPQPIAVNPATNRIYVVNSGSDEVAVIDGVSNTAVSVPAGADPYSVAVNPRTNKAYVVSRGSGELVVIDGATNATTTLAVGSGPRAVAVNPISNKIYVANSNSNDVTVIDGATNACTTLAVGSSPRSLAVNLATNKVYVPNSSDDTVTVIDGLTNTTTTVAAGNGAEALAVNLATNRTYVANRSDATVTVVTEQEVAPIPLTVSITPLPGNVTFDAVTSFTIAAASAFAPTAPAVASVRFQVDTWQGEWLAASPDEVSFQATTPPLLPGTHILYAFATDSQDGTSCAFDTGACSPLVGRIAAYVFTVLAPPVDLEISNDDGAEGVTAGSTTTYTIVVANPGEGAAASGVFVTDDFPAACVSVSWTCSASPGSSCGAAYGTGDIAEVVSVAAVGTVSYTATCTLSGFASGSLANTAFVQYANDPDGSNDSATDADSIQALSPGTLYAVTGAANSASSLYTVDPETGATTLIGPTGFSHVTGIDFDPTTGTLYGVVSGSRELITIDPATGAGTLVGSTGHQIPDITIGPDGVLRGWSEDGDDPIVIDKATGAVTVTNSGLGTGNTGIAWRSPLSVYVKSGGDLFSVNATTGAATFLFSSPDALQNILENAPDGTLISGVRSGGEGDGSTQFYSFDVNSQAVTPLGLADVPFSAVAYFPAPPPTANLAIAKDDGVTEVAAGATTTYTIVASNSGPAEAAGVVVADALAGCAVASWTCSADGGSTCAALSGTGPIEEVVTLAVGGSVTYVASCTLSPYASGTLLNTAAVAYAGDLGTADNVATDEDAILNVPRRTLYAVTGAGNEGSWLYKVDPTTGNTTLIGPTGFSHVTGIDFDPTTGILYGVVSGGGGGGGEESAKAEPGQLPGPPEAPAQALITIDPATGAGTLVGPTFAQIPDITIGPDGVLRGWTEDGDDPVVIDKATGAVSVVSSDLLTSQTGVAWRSPQALFVKAEGELHSVQVSNGTSSLLLATGESLDNILENVPDGKLLSGRREYGGTQFFSIDVGTSTLVALGRSGVAFSAIAFGAEPEPAADLAIAKDDGVVEVTAGFATTYTIVVSNSGPNDALGAFVTDLFPPECASASWTCSASAGASCAAIGSGDIGDSVDIPAGGSVTYTASCTVSYFASGSLANTATVTYANDPEPSNDSATDTNPIFPSGQVLYAVTGAGNAASSLYTVDPVTGATTLIGPTGFSHVTGIDFDDTSHKLYGVVNDFPDTLLIDINRATGAGTVVATIGTYWIPDITIGPDGVLRGWDAGEQGGSNSPITIDKASGAVTVTPPSIESTLFQVGVAWESAGKLYVKADDELYLLDVPTGEHEFLFSTSFSMSNILENVPDGRLLSGRRFSDEGGGGTEFDLIDPATQTVTPLGTADVPFSAVAFGPPPPPVADLRITKDDGVSEVLAGTATTYTIVATNLGPNDIASATVFDVFPAACETVSWTCLASSGEVVATEAFDEVEAPALPDGWVSTVDAGPAPGWQTSTGSSDTAPNSAFVDDPGETSDKRLETPAFAVPASGLFRVAFRNAYDTEYTFDGGVLEISIDGSPFEDILAAGGSFMSGGYDTHLNSESDNPLAGRPAWTGSSGGYVDTVATLPAAANGHSVRLRFRLGSDISVPGNGWHVDGFRLESLAAACAAAAGESNIEETVSLPAGASVTYLATCTLSEAASGTLVNTATVSDPFDPDMSNNSATDENTILTVQPTMTVVTSNDADNDVSVGTLVTFTASVSVGGGSQSEATPTGTVQFRKIGVEGTTDLGGPVLLVGGQAQVAATLEIAGTKTITAEYVPSGDFEPSSGSLQVIVRGTPAVVGQLLIREFRFRGPAGSVPEEDEYVDVYNAGPPLGSPASHTVATNDGSDGYAVAKADGGVLFVIPNGTLLPKKGNYLGVNENGFSLGFVPDATWAADIEDDSGLALFNSATNLTLATRLDAVGFDVESTGSLYKEGAGLAPLGSSGGQYTMFRQQPFPTGRIKDTGNNAADFLLVATDAGEYNGRRAALGAPNPQGTADAWDTQADFTVVNLDPGRSATQVPNQVRTGSGNSGTIQFRRKITNNTGGPVSRLRVRILDVSTLWGLGYSNTAQADIRPASGPDFNQMLSIGGTVAVQGLTRETPDQPMDGGYNTTLLNPDITLATPLAAGASININVLCKIYRTGAFKYYIAIETMDASGPPPGQHP